MKIFLYGEDKFRLAEKLKKIKDELSDKNTSVSVFDFEEDFSLENLRKTLKAQELFADKKVIIVKNTCSVPEANNKKNILEFLEKYLKDDPGQNIRVIFYEDDSPTKKDKIFQWFLKNFESQEYKKLNETQLKKWIRDEFARVGKEIDDEAVYRLVECCGNDLFQLKNETAKIIDFLGKENNKVGKQDLTALLSSKSEADIFRTIEFLASGNKKMALETLHKQLSKGDDPFYILTMYIYQFRNLLKIADFYFKGSRNHYEIAGLTKLHPFVVQKGLKNLEKLNMTRLKEVYQKLEKIDSDVKTGKGNIESSLDFLIAEV